MTRLVLAVVVFVLAIPGSVAAQQIRPCEQDSVHHQFDFWIGDWDVLDAGGAHVGRNTIAPMAAGCALLESWRGDRGGTGNSINYFDPESQRWVQTWVGGAGYVIDLMGGIVEGEMRLDGRYVQPDGSVQPFRGTWTPLDDGRVRQFLETSTDGGATFQTWFEGFYVRVE